MTLLQGEGLVNLSNTSRGDLISVISVLAEVDDTAEISGAWEKLNISAIIGAGNSTAVTGLSYPSVLPENRDYYYTIQVLKTSPPHYEFVQWFVLQNRIKVPRPFLEQLRTVRNFNDEPITLNNRDAQPLNGRIVSVLPSSVALDLVFTNDTPQVNGSGILHAEFATNTPGTDIFLTCRWKALVALSRRIVSMHAVFKHIKLMVGIHEVECRCKCSTARSTARSM